MFEAFHNKIRGEAGISLLNMVVKTTRLKKEIRRLCVGGVLGELEEGS